MPREIASAAAFDNAMILDMAMGGSTNTVLHILAIAHEAGVPFTLDRIAELSRKTPNICKVAPSSNYHIEDVARAGGIHTILGEIARGRPGLLDLDCPTVTGKTLGENIAEYDIRSEPADGAGPAPEPRPTRARAIDAGMDRPERRRRSVRDRRSAALDVLEARRRGLVSPSGGLERPRRGRLRPVRRDPDLRHRLFRRKAAWPSSTATSRPTGPW